MGPHLVFEDTHVTELAHFGQLSGNSCPVSGVVLVGEYGHPALSTVILLLSLRVPLSCLVAGEMPQPGGSGGELKEEVSQSEHSRPEPTHRRTLAGQ